MSTTETRKPSGKDLNLSVMKWAMGEKRFNNLADEARKLADTPYNRAAIMVAAKVIADIRGYPVVCFIEEYLGKSEESNDEA